MKRCSRTGFIHHTFLSVVTECKATFRISLLTAAFWFRVQIVFIELGLIYSVVSLSVDLFPLYEKLVKLFPERNERVGFYSWLIQKLEKRRK